MLIPVPFGAIRPRDLSRAAASSSALSLAASSSAALPASSRWLLSDSATDLWRALLWWATL